MNRRSFIKRAALGIVGLATGWGLLKPMRKWMPGHVVNHVRRVRLSVGTGKTYATINAPMSAAIHGDEIRLIPAWSNEEQVKWLDAANSDYAL